VGKYARRLLKHGKPEKALTVKDLWRVSNNEIRVQFDVPYKPLRLDNTWVFPVINGGFKVFAGTVDAKGAQAVITGVSVISDDTIAITTSTTIASGSSFTVEYGDEKTGKLASAATISGFANGAAFANGRTCKEIAFAGDVRAEFAPFLRNGAFYVESAGGFASYVREIRFASGTTYLRCETAETTGTPANGNTLAIYHPWGLGSLVDSDPALSIYKFTDTTYGSHQGEYYPLHNYAINFIEAVRTT
jgi:hypothetical protein